jgi:hypothetical protein
MFASKRAISCNGRLGMIAFFLWLLDSSGCYDRPTVSKITEYGSSRVYEVSGRQRTKENDILRSNWGYEVSVPPRFDLNKSHTSVYEILTGFILVLNGPVIEISSF